MSSANLPAVRAGSAVAVPQRLPSRRSPVWLAATSTLAASSGVAGATVYAANGSAAGSWLVVAAGVSTAAALLQAADLHRRAP